MGKGEIGDFVFGLKLCKFVQTKTTLMKIRFDEKGRLHPYEVIEMSIENFESIFVERQENVGHRRIIFEKYLDFNKELEDVVGRNYFQFVNGSFTTLKTTPGDIDVVSFVDYYMYKKHQDALEDLFYRKVSVKYLDAYILPISKPGYPDYIENQISLEWWKSLFGFTKSKVESKREPKGFIKIDFK